MLPYSRVTTPTSLDVAFTPPTIPTSLDVETSSAIFASAVVHQLV